jgi:hypothetical protein
MPLDMKLILEQHAALRRSLQQNLAQMQSGDVRVYERKSGKQQRDMTQESIGRITAEVEMLDSIDRSIKESLES